MRADPYHSLRRRLLGTIPESRLIDDPLRRLAYGRDASFYDYTPRLVVKTHDEREVIALLREAASARLPVTFRAAGTSLSGQAVTDSILAVLGPTWNGYTISAGGERIALQPGVIGADANMYLAPYGRKIGPDPASINAAMIGGIAANNASGMCCGTAQNSYRTLSSMRIILADATILDTGDNDSREAFRSSHAPLIARVADIAARVKANGPLADRIRRKYKMKNTTGYSLNALVDFDDPLDIIQHLMIGSEGTLGFIAEVTFNTVPEYAHKATSLILFPDIAAACGAVAVLREERVDAVELMDRASLRSVETKEGMPEILKTLDTSAAALLVETRAPESGLLDDQVAKVSAALAQCPTLRPVQFTAVAPEYTRLWDIRKGLFPSVGAMRRTGTTVIIEDVAFPVPDLARATLDLQSLFRRHGYDDAIIFGHALEGNLHFVFSQDFNAQSEVDRYSAFLEDVTNLVVTGYDGSLKAEHGTGRNMAPFVELEWGAEAYGLMREIKSMFDPEGLLNPGVMLNDDRAVHLKHLKPLPAADPIVDKCIECGFCEVHCPSKNLTLTPRQRIAAYREIVRRRASSETLREAEQLASLFEYEGDATCATDGLCATSCPVGIDTGMLVKVLRSRRQNPATEAIAHFIGSHMAGTTAGLRLALGGVQVMHRLFGPRAMGLLTRGVRALSGGRIPMWNRWMPGPADRLELRRSGNRGGRQAVVYVPGCINRTFGPPKGSMNRESVTTVVLKLISRAGLEAVIPDGIENLCCGMAFASKGFVAEGDRKSDEMRRAILKASGDGKLPVLMDMSPCLYRMKEKFVNDLRLYEPVRFALEWLVPRLHVRRIAGPVALHTTCSARKMGLDRETADLLRHCASHVIIPEGIECCGWAGDRGFTVPALNASALAQLREQIPEGCVAGYSTSRTCEIGLSLHGGIEYQSVLNLLEQCSREVPK